MIQCQMFGDAKPGPSWAVRSPAPSMTATPWAGGTAPIVDPVDIPYRLGRSCGSRRVARRCASGDRRNRKRTSIPQTERSFGDPNCADRRLPPHRRRPVGRRGRPSSRSSRAPPTLANTATDTRGARRSAPSNLDIPELTDKPVHRWPTNNLVDANQFPAILPCRQTLTGVSALLRLMYHGPHLLVDAQSPRRICERNPPYESSIHSL